MHLKLSSAKWRLFGLGLNELKECCLPYVKNIWQCDKLCLDPAFDCCSNTESEGVVATSFAYDTAQYWYVLAH